MRILILGGTNFIGPPVVRELAAGGHAVAVFHRGNDDALTRDGVQHIHGDRANIHAHRDDFARFAPDTVIDMHAMTEADGSTALEAIRGIARRAVLISSIDVYRAYGRLHGSEPGPPESMPLTEDAPLRERLYPYRGDGDGGFDDYDKIPIEQMYLADREVTSTVLRLPAVHGERDYQRRLRAELRVMDAGAPEYLLAEEAADWRWPRAYVGNVAHAIALAVTTERASGRIYNVAEPTTWTMLEWVRTVGRLAGWSGEVVLRPMQDLPASLRSSLDLRQDIVADSTRIREELGHAEIVPPESGIMHAIAWEREQAARDSIEQR